MTWIDDNNIQKLFSSAHAALLQDGIKTRRARRCIRDAIVAVFGNDQLDDEKLLRLYLIDFYERTGSGSKLVKDRQYTPDRAMQVAIKRSQTQPRIIGVN